MLTIVFIASLWDARARTALVRQAVARVNDNDGKFLLIEAAESIPAWLNPDSAGYRIFIHQGSIHIVPQPRSPVCAAANTSQPFFNAPKIVI